MTTIKETIVGELLDSIGDSSGLRVVLDRHRKSKGPLYGALSEVISQLQERLLVTGEKFSDLDARRIKLEANVDALAAHHLEMEENVRILENQIAEAEKRLADSEETLNQAKALEAQGFGKEELSRLSELLGQAAALHGLAPEQGVYRFFETARDYSQVISFEFETQAAESRTATAKAEAKRWEAEAKSKEAHSMARIATINTVERLLEKGVREKDFRQWERILEKVGVSAENVAKELERYGSLEKLFEEHSQRSEELHRQVDLTDARLKSLRKEEVRVKASIWAIRDGALKEMEQTGNQARQHLDGLLVRLMEYGELQQAANTLKDDMALARAFKILDPEEWGKVPRFGIQRLILGVILWSKKDGRNRMIAPPKVVSQRNRSLTSWHQVSLVDLMVWALSAVATEEDMRALVGG